MVALCERISWDGAKCDVNFIAITIVVKSRSFIVNALDDLEDRSELV